MAERSKLISFYDKEKMQMVNPETLKLWKRYETEMSLRGLSDLTIKNYYNDLVHLWIYTLDNFDNKCFTELTEDDILDFLYYCKRNGNNSRRIRRRMASMSAFFIHLRKKRVIKESPMDFIERPKKDETVVVQTFLTEEQVEQLRKVLNEKFVNAVGVHAKHLALMKLVYVFLSLSSMARVKAISSITWEQINFEERLIKEVKEKEGKIVELYFSEEVRFLLQNLLKFRQYHNIRDDGSVFIVSDKNHKQISTVALSQWCKSIGKLIDVPTLHPHDFRHSGSQLMKLKGANVEDISALLNHAGTDVTIKHYLKSDSKQMREQRDRYGI